MKTNILAIAVGLSDQDLLSRINVLAGHEREATAELVAHLAALELRPSLYVAQGYGSLFAYCTEALRLSEDAACSRIEAARACRRFPVILDLLASAILDSEDSTLYDPDRAFSLANRAVKTDMTDTGRYRATLAWAHYECGRRDKAIQWMEQAIALDPEGREAYEKQLALFRNEGAPR